MKKPTTKKSVEQSKRDPLQYISTKEGTFLLSELSRREAENLQSLYSNYVEIGRSFTEIRISFFSSGGRCQRHS